MASYNIIVSPKASDSIRSFYRNVSKKYCHTYSYELMTKNITDAINSMYQIENGLQRRTPTINRWKGKGYLMANTKKWYYAYVIDVDTILIEDACHAQNMHDSRNIIGNIIAEIINEYLKENLIKQ